MLSLCLESYLKRFNPVLAAAANSKGGRGAPMLLTGSFGKLTDRAPSTAAALPFSDII